MIRTLPWAFSWAVVVSMAPNPAAATGISDGARTLFLASVIPDKMRDVSGRLEFVKAAKTFCDKVAQVLPRNSPSENGWLNAEIVAGGDRSVRALGSIEFARRQTQTFVSNCQSSASGYLSDEARDNKLIAIISLAHAFAQFAPDAESSAKRAGIAGDDHGFSLLGKTSEQATYAALIEATKFISEGK